MSNRTESLYKAGAHVGYSKSRRHPSVRPFLFGMKHRSDIINLEQTSQQIDTAIAALKAVVVTGKKVALAGTKPEIKRLITDLAKETNMPYATKRWVGGTLTNIGQIRARVDLLDDLISKKESGNLVYRTKKELLLIDRKIDKLELNFGGLRGMKELPAMLLVVDPKKEVNAIAEARQRHIPIVAIASTDCDVSIIDYPIVANDTNVESVGYILSELQKGLMV